MQRVASALDPTAAPPQVYTYTQVEPRPVHGRMQDTVYKMSSHMPSSKGGWGAMVLRDGKRATAAFLSEVAHSHASFQLSLRMWVVLKYSRSLNNWTSITAHRFPQYV